ncbi:MAG TPA: hypothetical protein VGK79_00740 [Gaiellaceae bacterium]
MTGPGQRDTLETQVEQALAYGRSREWIRTRLGVDDTFIAGVIAAQRITLAADEWYQMHSAQVIHRPNRPFVNTCSMASSGRP